MAPIFKPASVFMHTGYNWVFREIPIMSQFWKKKKKNQSNIMYVFYLNILCWLHSVL